MCQRLNHGNHAQQSINDDNAHFSWPIQHHESFLTPFGLQLCTNIVFVSLEKLFTRSL